ncbi:MAG: DUF429 domain-containing protein [Rubrobacter sp.]|nr:DUF429 domain-containing protein [Rubrobacter sp.]
MRFVGCSLAWRPSDAKDGTSCLVVLDERGGIIANSFAASVGEVSGAVEGYTADRRGVIMGVDAPLSVPNERGTRKIERLLSKLALPAYSANRNMFGGEPPGEALLAALQGIGVEYTDYPFRRQRRQNVVVEVDSAAVLKVLVLERGQGEGDPEQRLRAMEDPKLRKGNKEGRAQAIKGAVDVLWNTPGLRMRTGNLAADLSASENVDVSRVEVASTLSHADLDRICSLVEATLAAYAVLRHWKGRDGSAVVGMGDAGSVLLPAGEPLHARIAEECRASGIPYV